jgi:hypothetical protein
MYDKDVWNPRLLGFRCPPSTAALLAEAERQQEILSIAISMRSTPERKREQMVAAEKLARRIEQLRE